MPQREQFIVSDILKRYAFDSYYTAHVKGLNESKETQTLEIQIQRSYDYTKEVISFLARMIGTIMIELLIAVLFRLREQKILRVIILTNLVTQGILNILLNMTLHTEGSLMFIFNYIGMECLVIWIEAIIYSGFCKRNQDVHISSGLTKGYAIIANMASFIGGVYIAHLIPGIF